MKKLLLPVLFLQLSLLVSGELWKNGKTEYVIALPDPPSAESVFAAKELKTHLEKSSGCEFKLRKLSKAGNAPRIFIGEPSEVKKLYGKDFSGLKKGSSVITTSGNDLILTGPGNGMNYAVYDFLEKEIGVRWFSPLPGGTMIPKYAEKSFSGKTTVTTPAFPERAVYTDLCANAQSMTEWFYRNRENASRYFQIYAVPGRHAEVLKNDLGHGLFLYIPPDGRFQNYYKWNTPKTYFQDHPDYFTMNPSGQRIPNGQLCFSNPELRKELTRRMFEHISIYGDGDYMLAANDWPGSFCYCPACQILEKKYGSIGGPIYDYLVELCAELAEKHPNVRITTLAYRKAQSERPPVGIEKMPDNLIIDFAPIDDNQAAFLDSESNADTFRNLKEWKRLAKNMAYWYYGCSLYPLGIWERMQKDIQTLAETGVQTVGYCGGDSLETSGFQNYLYLRLLIDPNLDAVKAMTEYTDYHYGKAAPLVREYWNELEDLRRQTKDFLTYETPASSVRYLTPERLQAWENRYGKMLELAGDNKFHRANILEGKAVMSVFLAEKFSKNPELLEKYTKEKLLALIHESAETLNKMMPQNPGIVKQLLASLEESEIYTSVQKMELPAELEEIPPGKIRRVLFLGNTEDPEAATGKSLSSPIQLNADGCVEYGYYDRISKKQSMRGSLKSSEIEPGKYKLYHLGRTAFSPDSLIWTGTWHNDLRTGSYSPVGDEFREFDIYARIKFTGKSFPGGNGPDMIHRDQFFLVEK